MKQVEWSMKETFAFAQNIGRATSAKKIQVTPRYNEEAYEGRPKLTGIYHLAVTAHLSKKPLQLEEDSEVIVIDDVDAKDGTGYFEYAVPFTIDFPPEAENPVSLQTVKPNYEIDDGGCLVIVWDVQCTYHEEGIEKQRQQDQEKQMETSHADEAEVEAKKPVVIEETSEKVMQVASASSDDDVLQFMGELEDGISKTSFRLNDIFV